MQQIYYVTARPDSYSSQISYYQRITIKDLNEILKNHPSAEVVSITAVKKGANGLSSDAFVVVKFDGIYNDV